MNVRLLRKLRNEANKSYYIEMVTKKGGVRFYSIKDHRDIEVICSYTLDGAKTLLSKIRSEEFERMRFSALNGSDRRKRMRY